MKSNIINTSDFRGWFSSIACLIFLTLVNHSAAAYTAMSLGEVAGSITESFTNLAKLITSGAYLAGLGFSIGAIMKFKQHKDNPTQIPIGTPIALLFISAALLFLPSILDVTSATMFGDSGGQTAGPHGIVFANRQ
ncbi:type IV secretion protein IcmD [Legionella bononiensis]|uniref:Type IV secretion protein IcmD n=1 Tax=Legionella bononiensis TaxID=2793102 RepID=A0ABS1W8V7_9GAMM|nr:type IV secretion protein IcmD [Legionella bononiensis]MBL7525790.1 type IV secretion protein IcmD [Legionella bononiensis]MBL7561972.1 type IV secretion protein IcmD [Legionella bononiensis]